ncbi:connectin-like [Pseudomyrmex gracilis]|uniref:connectin-like n=1 Tax=Pseudomyrmex gracilis TaxID=219809 RepID=UPI000995CB25|nr:connectin-like [Pseudomyrmex gracilis]
MRSSLYTFFNIELLVAILFVSSYSVASKSHGNKKNISKETKESKEVDICNIENRYTPIICYCTTVINGNIDVQNATKINASCLILEKLEHSNSIWNYFTSQPYLEQLMFTVRSNDSFDYVPSQMLRQLNNLRVVKFRYAKLDELAERAFSNLVSIQEISLKRNTIVVLHKYAFENMKNLAAIDLDENRISEINRDTFVNLPILRSLHLNRNNISNVHDRAFKYLNSLRELELSDNQIVVVKRDSFHGLSNLLRLDLSNNLISTIDERSFVEMPELVELKLDQNQIKYISGRALDGMRNLRKLLLSENQLMTLTSDFLVGAPGVNFLDLRNNNLKTMTFDNIKPIIFNLYSTDSQFYLNDNRLICDCKLAWIWGLQHETKSTKLKDALKELICILDINESQKINNENFEKSQQRKITQNFSKFCFAYKETCIKQRFLLSM